MDHLQAIRIFSRVVETGSFTQAAQSLDIPNTTVSKWVRTLEKHLGVTLLERSTRRVTVTTDGAAYYERTRFLLSELDDIESTLGRAHGSPKGVLRVETGGSVASGLLIPALPSFRSRYPDIQLQVGVADRTADLIAENIDCAIRSTSNDPALVTQRVGSLRWATFASPSYLATHGTPVHPRQLMDDTHSVVGYFSAASGTTQSPRFVNGDEDITLDTLRHDLQVNESNAHLATAAAGLGIVQTIEFMARPLVARGELVPILEGWAPNPIEVFMVFPPSRRYNTKVRVFVDWVKALFLSINP